MERRELQNTRNREYGIVIYTLSIYMYTYKALELDLCLVDSAVFSVSLKKQLPFKSSYIV